MKIKWIRVLIAGIWAEALLLVVRIPIRLYFGAAPPIYIGVIVWFVPMFLGGLWVAKKLESRYILHGVLVGIVANIVFLPMGLLSSMILPATITDPNVQISNLLMVIVFIAAILVKILGSVFGSYIGGKTLKSVSERASNQSDTNKGNHNECYKKHDC